MFFSGILNPFCSAFFFNASGLTEHDLLGNSHSPLCIVNRVSWGESHLIICFTHHPSFLHERYFSPYHVYATCFASEKKFGYFPLKMVETKNGAKTIGSESGGFGCRVDAFASHSFPPSFHLTSTVLLKLHSPFRHRAISAHAGGHVSRRYGRAREEN